MRATGIDRRIRRLQVRGRFFVISLDHGLPAGPLRGIERPPALLRALRDVPFSAVIANPGMSSFIAEALPYDRGLIVNLSGGTLLGPNPPAKVLVSTVEHAVRLGADAVSIQISFGNSAEDRMLSDAGRVVDEAASLGVPVLALAYAAAKSGEPSSDAEAAAHAARVAAEIGASLVQTNYAGRGEPMRDIIAGCPVPVLVAGGPRSASEESFLEALRGALGAGAAGLSVGRQVFEAANPAAVARHVADVLFESTTSIAVEAAR